MAKEEKWTVVQHSAFGYNEDPQFAQGLESRAVETKTEQNLVIKVGGILFDSYKEAEDFAQEAMYPADNPSIVPRAKGEFSTEKIDGLAIYIPVREVIG